MTIVIKGTIEKDEQKSTQVKRKSYVITLSGECTDERARQSAPRVGCLMSAFVLQNDGNRRGERWLSRPPQLHKRDTTINCKSRGLSKFTYELVRELDKSRRNTYRVQFVNNGEPPFSCFFLYFIFEKCMQHISALNARQQSTRYKKKWQVAPTYTCIYAPFLKTATRMRDRVELRKEIRSSRSRNGPAKKRAPSIKGDK